MMVEVVLGEVTDEDVEEDIWRMEMVSVSMK